MNAGAGAKLLSSRVRQREKPGTGSAGPQGGKHQSLWSRVPRWFPTFSPASLALLRTRHRLQSTRFTAPSPGIKHGSFYFSKNTGHQKQRVSSPPWPGRGRELGEPRSLPGAGGPRTSFFPGLHGPDAARMGPGGGAVTLRVPSTRCYKRTRVAASSLGMYTQLAGRLRDANTTTPDAIFAW